MGAQGEILPACSPRATSILTKFKGTAAIHQPTTTKSKHHQQHTSFYHFLGAMTGTQDDNTEPTGEEITVSPAKQKLNSMVLGDGSFEALMKERSKVSTSCADLDCCSCRRAVLLHCCAYDTVHVTTFRRNVTLSAQSLDSFHPTRLYIGSFAKKRKSSLSHKSSSNSLPPNEPSPQKPNVVSNPPTPYN
jgi:hypothetical protein